jgi:hypothetical protein
MKSPNCLAALIAAACLAPLACAQSPITTPNGARSDAINLKIRQIDILVQVLPLAIRKEQFSPLLGAIEKARAKQKQIVGLEDSDLAKIDGDVTTALNNALQKGAFPPREMQIATAKLFRAMAIRRQVAVGEMLDDLCAAIKKIFDEGQLKVMANSLDPYLIDPSIKKDSLTQDGKVRFFVQQIILDPVAYDVLLKLDEKAG